MYMYVCTHMYVCMVWYGMYVCAYICVWYGKLCMCVCICIIWYGVCVYLYICMYLDFLASVACACVKKTFFFVRFDKIYHKVVFQRCFESCKIVHQSQTMLEFTFDVRVTRTLLHGTYPINVCNQNSVHFIVLSLIL